MGAPSLKEILKMNADIKVTLDEAQKLKLPY
jgi:hypothetical protein